MRERYELVPYLCGTVAARTGDETSGPALLLVGIAATGSAATGSALLAGVTAAAAIGGPVLGVVLDRARRPGRLLAVILTVNVLGLALVALLLEHLPLAPVLILALAVGSLGPALSGGWTAQLPRLVTPDRLTRANAWDAMTFGAASLVGPALAGTVALGLGAMAAVMVAVALIGLAAPLAWSLPSRPTRPVPTPVLDALAAGVRAVLRNRALARVTVVSTISIAGTGMFVVAAPVLGERLLGGAPYGALLLSVMAVCALTANLVVALRPVPVSPDTMVSVCTLVQVSGVVGVLLAPSAFWLWPAVAVLGAAEGPQLTALFTVRHREAPDHLRTQVFTTAASLKVSAFAAGAALAGPLADHALTLCLAVAAATQVVAALVALLVRPSRPGRGRRGVPTESVRSRA
ncbi:MFS transporter [Nocardiopsis sp. MG754419]|uniref:MFS transporter n=1 Tax=Nocardiopsis sp. MG754419 TaxID=2259865 RepID=UPI001BA56C6F|nr:MFS transporter [Nocardiopsis sp. MG754419]MBR8745230.1 MFS transporter [Nocardiopsis sp. MG754419]